MTITVQPVNEEFVAEIADVDLREPLAADEVERIAEAFEHYAVLIFPEQHLDDEQHIAVAKLFGPLDEQLRGAHRSDERKRTRAVFADISNLNDDGSLWDANSRVRQDKMGNRLWHTDGSFRHIPARCSLLYAREVPPVGGHTQFADMRAAYEALPTSMRKRLNGLIAEHSIVYSRAQIGFNDFIEGPRNHMAYVPQALVRTQRHRGGDVAAPLPCRASLYLAAHAGRVFGVPDGEGRALIDELIIHATQAQFVYSHRWRVHDLVIWDNRCTMHRGTEYDDLRWPRDLVRLSVSDEVNSCELEGLSLPAEAVARPG